VIGEAPGDLQRTSSEGFTPYIEPSAAGAVREQVISESLGGRPIYIPVIDGSSGATDLLGEDDQSRGEKPSTSAPAPAPAPSSPGPTTPSPKVREEMIAEVKDRIRAEIAGASVQNEPLKLIDIAAPLEEVNLGLAKDRERMVEEALRPYQALLSRVQEASAVDLVIGDVQGRAEATTRLVLRPMAKAVAGRGGIAVAAPLSRAVVRGEQPVRVRYEPNIVAVAGPSGMAHALGELLLQYPDPPQI